MQKTHCVRGHEYTSSNTYLVKGDKFPHHRVCKECHRLREIERRKRTKEEELELVTK